MLKLLEMKSVSQHKLLVGDLELNTTFTKSVAYHQNENYGSYQTKKSVCSLQIALMKVQSPFKIHRILTELGIKLKLAWLMLVILLVLWHRVISQEKRKHGGGIMWFDCNTNEKRRLWKEWQNGGDKEKYLQAKRKANSAVYKARKSQIWWS